MAHQWGYDTSSCSPCKWGTLYPIANTGKKQSPIDVITEGAQHEEFPKLDFCYNEDEIKTLENNGHSVTFHLTGGTSTLKGGPFGSDEYALLQFHFHWGSDNSKGSEHFLNGHQFPAEMHLVHMNKKYTTTPEAFKHSDGLAVVGVFIEVDKNHQEFQAIVNNLSSVQQAKTKTNVSGNIKIMDILPKKKNYNYYQGSLTTPGLFECVSWINMLEPISISDNQICEFRKLFFNYGGSMVNNFRPCQALHGRKMTVVEEGRRCHSHGHSHNQGHGHSHDHDHGRK